MKNGGPAFPNDYPGYERLGMSLRDYFAAAAMQGIMAAPTDSGWDRNSLPPEIAAVAYGIADAMLEERGQ